MDYEKMYKEAVGKIQELLEEKKKKEMTNCLFEGELNEIFSELRESEDERIKKYIISFIELNSGVNLSPDDAKRMLAWLEKPKTEKVYLRFKVGDVVCSSNGTTLKIVGITDYCYNCTTTEGNKYSFGFDIQDEFELVEDKKEWSEEDEDMINSIIRELIHQYNEEIPQGTEDEIKWLKSLKDRYNWKPSEEELTAILVARNNVNSINADILRKLYNELKRL